MDLNTLVELAEIKAKVENDGHFTIMKFTTGYKVLRGTPNLDGISSREKISALRSFMDLEDALIFYLTG